MLIEKVKKLSVIERFIYWINQREEIRLKKLAGDPWPFTDDEILRTYRFCNCVRIEDKVSQWLMNNWYTPFRNKVLPETMYVACAIARFFNKIETLGPLTPYVFNNTMRIKNGHLKRIEEIVRKRKESGEKVFNGAYIVTGQFGEDKIDGVVNYFIRPLVDKMPLFDPDSMEYTWSQLIDRQGFGSFSSGQVVADLRHSLQGEWSDAKTWAPMGPGSKRGLNRLLGREIGSVMNQEEFLKELTTIIQVCRKSIPTVLSERMEMIDWQNCCCEMDKMERTLWEGRRPKQIYKRLSNADTD